MPPPISTRSSSLPLAAAPMSNPSPFPSPPPNPIATAYSFLHHRLSRLASRFAAPCPALAAAHPPGPQGASLSLRLVPPPLPTASSGPSDPARPDGPPPPPPPTRPGSWLPPPLPKASSGPSDPVRPDGPVLPPPPTRPRLRPDGPAPPPPPTRPGSWLPPPLPKASSGPSDPARPDGPAPPPPPTRPRLRLVPPPLPTASSGPSDPAPPPPPTRPGSWFLRCHRLLAGRRHRCSPLACTRCAQILPALGASGFSRRHGRPTVRRLNSSPPAPLGSTTSASLYAGWPGPAAAAGPDPCASLLWLPPSARPEASAALALPRAPPPPSSLPFPYSARTRVARPAYGRSPHAPSPGYSLEDATGLSLNEDLDIESIFAGYLPNSHPSFAPQRYLEMSEQWKASPLPTEPVELFIGVLSAANHFAESMAVRKSWMIATRKSPNIVARFFVALNGEKEVNEELKKEAEFFGDIVVVPFIDSYDHVVSKTIAIAEYGVRVVPAKYIMKCDDDTFVRIDLVLDQVKKIQSGGSLYVGNINYYHRPLRSGKWAVTYEEWQEEVYPPYANGPGYVISSDIAQYIVSEFDNQTLRLFKMEDVSMGMWIEKFNSTRQPVEYLHDVRFYQSGCFDGYYTAHYQSPQHMICLWRKLQSGSAQCCNVR